MEYNPKRAETAFYVIAMAMILFAVLVLATS